MRAVYIQHVHCVQRVQHVQRVHCVQHVQHVHCVQNENVRVHRGDIDHVDFFKKKLYFYTLLRGHTLFPKNPEHHTSHSSEQIARREERKRDVT